MGKETITITERDLLQGIEAKDPDTLKRKNNLCLETPWMLTQESFRKLIATGNIAAKNPKAFMAFLKAHQDFKGEGPKFRREGSIAIIGITGIIFRYDTASASLFGETTIQTLTEQFETAMDDDTIKGILLDVNSPGGEADGTPEFAETVLAAREIKPVVAYVSNMAASAAYWIASAAQTIVAHESAMVGSIGVVVSAFETDKSIDIVSAVSPKKVVDVSTDEGKAQIQTHVDALAKIFVNRIAAHRGVEASVVLDDFGQGDVLLGVAAKGAKMVDSVGNFKSALALLRTMIKTNGAKAVNTVSKIKTQSKKETSKRRIEVVVFDDEEQETPEGLETEPLNKEWLEENMPELIEEIKEDGSEDEGDRQEEIDEVAAVSDEEKKMKHDAKYGKKISAGELSRKFVALRAAQKKTEMQNRVDDAGEIPEVTAEPVDNDEDASAGIMKAAAQALVKSK